VGHPFDGIYEKLKRSGEHIRNLESESDRFFEERGYKVLPHDDSQLLLKAFQDLEKLDVPLRFSVLMGEVAHHLRSCLDHIVWQFSSPEYRNSKDGRAIEFPILKARPGDKNRFPSYERKIQGVTHPGVLDMIEQLQPYNSTKPRRQPLFLIHHLDITDKHRELVLCASTGGIAVDALAFQETMARYQQGVITETEAQIYLKDYANFAPMIAFRDLGKGEPEAVVPLLYDLHNVVARIVAAFRKHLP